MSGPLALGRTAEIYPHGDDGVLKLFRTWVPLEDVEAEQHKAQIAHSIGIPTPSVGALVHRDGRVGLVFERVEGETVLERILAEPDSVEPLARLMADLHGKLHGVKPADGLPAQREIVAARISRCGPLSKDERGALLGALEELQSGESFCHGDFHPGNVMITDHGPVIIDWLDASRGNPIGDVARTTVLFLGHMAHERVEPERFAAVRLFHETYIDRYKESNPDGWLEYQKWIPIMAAARLQEGIKDQENWLLEQVRAGLAQW